MAAKKKRYKVGDKVWYRLLYAGSSMRHGTIARLIHSSLSGTPVRVGPVAAYAMSNGDIVRVREVKGLYP